MHLLWKVVRTSRRGLTERSRQEQLGEFRLEGRSDIGRRMGLLRWDYGGLWAGRIVECDRGGTLFAQEVRCSDPAKRTLRC